MTVCNMSIEAGARAGLVAPDDTTYEYLAGRPFAPGGADWDAAVGRWRRPPGAAGAGGPPPSGRARRRPPRAPSWARSPTQGRCYEEALSLAKRRRIHHSVGSVLRFVSPSARPFRAG